MDTSFSFKKKKRKYTKIKNNLSDEIIHQTISEHLKLFESNYTTLPIEISLQTLLIPSKKKKTFKKPPNPFILYRKYLRFTILSKNKNASMDQISKFSSKMWNEASSEIKSFFYNLSIVVANAYKVLNSYTNGANGIDLHKSTKESKYSSYTFPIKYNSPDSTHSNHVDVTIPSTIEYTLGSELINNNEQIEFQQYEIYDDTYTTFPSIYTYDETSRLLLQNFNFITEFI